MSGPTNEGSQLARTKTNGTTTTTVSLAIRVPVDLAVEFERVAVGEERTVSGEIRRLMRLRVAEMTPNGEVATA